MKKEIESIIKPIIENLDLILVDIFFGLEDGKKSLIITIDSKDRKIDIKDCVKVSKAIDPALEEADIIKESYDLIVSSPGKDIT